MEEKLKVWRGTSLIMGQEKSVISLFMFLIYFCKRDGSGGGEGEVLIEKERLM